MPQSKVSYFRVLASHRGAFVTSLVIGAVLTLGVRSLFVNPDGTPTMAAAETAADHHAKAGHAGHVHDSSSASEGMPAMPAEDGHGSHGKKEGENKDEAAGEKNGEGSHGAEGEAGAGESVDKKKGDAKAAGAAKFVSVLLDLGNKSCPVMGGDANGKTFSEWNGLRVGYCCAGCDKRFLKNPESLLDEVSPKWRAAAAAAKAINAAKGEAREALLAKTAKSWTVVRQPVGNAPKVPTAPAGLLVDLGNEACPLMGGDVDGKTFTEWNGLRVGHCCPGCSKRFLANPEALLDEVAPKWRDAAKAVQAVKSAKGAARKAALTKLQKKWKVVREPAGEKPVKTDSKDTK